jgi:hypothetical protein
MMDKPCATGRRVLFLLMFAAAAPAHSVTAQCAASQLEIVVIGDFDGIISPLGIMVSPGTRVIGIDSKSADGTLRMFATLRPSRLPEQLKGMQVVGSKKYHFDVDTNITSDPRGSTCVASVSVQVAELWAAAVETRPEVRVGLIPPGHPCPGVVGKASTWRGQLATPQPAWCIDSGFVYSIQLTLSREELQRAKDSTIVFDAKRLGELRAARRTRNPEGRKDLLSYAKLPEQVVVRMVSP